VIVDPVELAGAGQREPRASAIAAAIDGLVMRSLTGTANLRAKPVSTDFLSVLPGPSGSGCSPEIA
jgi:hypothetical protein